MRAVTWLHISDFHFRESEAWPQNAVLSAMLEDIERRREAGLAVDFVLATGDLAFSGKESEYDLVEAFFEKLSETTGLPREVIFCVPGNHDIQRERYKMSFAGAREKLQSQNDIYDFLSDTEERDTLLLRQNNFSRFQDRFFAKQKRKRTSDHLGYVSFLEIDDLHIAIIGLNSAWLSEGGVADERQLLLGEHQVKKAIDIAVSGSPHVIVGIQHHPFDFLKRFDQQSTQHRLEKSCHLIHCGHLHEPDASQAAVHSGKCLTLAAGALFESRGFRNAYSTITLDPLYARAKVTFIQYEPLKGQFSYVSPQCYPLAIGATDTCRTIELAAAIKRYCPDAVDVSYYLASLLLGDVSDVPIPTNNTVVFGAPALLLKQNDEQIVEATSGAMAAGRAVQLLHGRKTLDEILTNHGAPVRLYVEILRTLGASDNGVWEKLVMRNNDAARLAGTENVTPFAHTLGLMDDLLEDGDWDGLRELSERCSMLDYPTVASKGKRMLALCLARSDERSNHQRATDLYREIAASAYGEASDWAAIATLLTDDGDHEQAKIAIMEGVSRFPEKSAGFVDIGMKIVNATSDTALRDELRTLRQGEKGQ